MRRLLMTCKSDLSPMSDLTNRHHKSAYRRDGRGMTSHRHPLPLPGSLEWPSARTAMVDGSRRSPLGSPVRHHCGLRQRLGDEWKHRKSPLSAWLLDGLRGCRPLRRLGRCGFLLIVVLGSFDSGGVGAPRFPPSAVFTGTFFTGVQVGLLLIIFQRCRLMR